MNIISCPKCGALIHQESKCCHCGTTVIGKCVSKPKIHPNVRKDYEMAWDLLQKRMFDEALQHSTVLTLWMPGDSSVYWLRLLARRRCISDLELICYAGQIKEDTDYQLAISCASKPELQVYKDVANLAEKVYQEMYREARKVIQQKKLDTGVLQKKVQLENDTRESFDQILKDWTRLAHVQQSIQDIVSEWRIVTAEEIQNMEAAISRIGAVSSDLYSKKECTVREHHVAFQTIEASELLMEAAVDKLQKMHKGHELNNKLKECVAEYNDLDRKIAAALEIQRKRQNEIQELIKKLERIDAEFMYIRSSNAIHHTKALTQVTGSAVLHKVCQKIGVTK